MDNKKINKIPKYVTIKNDIRKPVIMSTTIKYSDIK